MFRLKIGYKDGNLLPVAFFQRIVGCGTPCAWQLITVCRFLSTFTSIGSTNHLGGTGTNTQVHSIFFTKRTIIKLITKSFEHALNIYKKLYLLKEFQK
jgi:hypothetical protein